MGPERGSDESCSGGEVPQLRREDNKMLPSPRSKRRAAAKSYLPAVEALEERCVLHSGISASFWIRPDMLMADVRLSHDNDRCDSGRSKGDDRGEAKPSVAVETPPPVVAPAIRIFFIPPIQVSESAPPV